MELSELEVLLAVAHEKGFSRAAEMLHRTQPAVSQAIRRLEIEVGRPLFDRSSKNGALTDAGRLLCEYANQMLNLRRDAQNAITELSHLQRGKITIAANEYTVMHILPEIAEFSSRYPQIRIEVKRSLAREIPSEVLRREVEMGVIAYRPEQPGLSCYSVAADELALLCAPSHPLAEKAKGSDISIRELGIESFLAHNVSSPWRQRVLQTFERHQTALNIVMELPTLESIKRLVEQGLGVALMPRYAARAEIAHGQIVALKVREMKLERLVYLVHRGDAKLSHAGRAFIDCVRRSREAEK